MNPFLLTDQSGQTYEASNLRLIANDSRLCSDLFGTSVPRNLDPSQAMAWAQRLYKLQLRRLENYRSVFLHNKEMFEQDGRMKGHLQGLI